MGARQRLQGDLLRLGAGVSKILKEMGRSRQRLEALPPPVATTVAVTKHPVVSDGRERAPRQEVDGSSAPNHREGDTSSHAVEPLRRQSSGSALPSSSTSKQEPTGATTRAPLPVARVPSNALHRAMSFASLGAKLVVGTALDSLSHRLSGPAGDGKNRTANSSSAHLSSHFITSKNAERLANHLSRLRGAALKLSQVLSMQDENVLPPQVQAALERVRAGADVMPAAQLEAMMESQLGDAWREKFVSFDELPMAAASIGQVHAAQIRDGEHNTVDVVCKVQYPGVAKSIDSDIDNLMRLVRMANVLPKGLYVENAVKVAKKELALECNYTYERNAQQKFRDLVQADPECTDEMRLRVPRVFENLCTDQILVTERVEGIHIDKVADLSQATRDAVGTRLLRLTLKELYEWRYMQSDPNWGNFLYDPDTDALSLIDFGAAKSFSTDFVADYLEMVHACAVEDEAEIIKRSISLGFLTGDESREMMEAHCQAGILVGAPFRTIGPHDFGGPSMTGRVTELGAVMLKHRLTPPPDESYSLHRKLSGTFLACIKLKAKVDAKRLFEEARARFYGASSELSLASG